MHSLYLNIAQRNAYMKQYRRALGVFFLLAAAGSAAAEDSPMLEIGGKIAAFTDQFGKVYRLSASQFQSMPQSSLTTSTSWTPVSKFKGVRMEEIMRLTGAKGEYAQIYALDDYSVRIPVADFKRYGVVLASSRDGKALDASKFGPYFLIYPKDRYPKELNTPTAEAKFVWQVSRIVFQ